LALVSETVVQGNPKLLAADAPGELNHQSASVSVMND
jgi:hypothetical protein